MGNSNGAEFEGVQNTGDETRGPLVLLSALQGTLEFATTSISKRQVPFPRAESCQGCAQPLRKGLAVVGGNGQATFHWAGFVCFLSLCGFTDAAPDANPETAA